jgi:hypothetical protein
VVDLRFQGAHGVIRTIVIASEARQSRDVFKSWIASSLRSSQ